MSGVKRLAVYFTVLVGCLFIGLTTYYLVKNYEFINVQADSELGAVYLNVGETYQMDFTHDLKQTDLEHTWGEEEFATFNDETGEITGLKAGETTLTITAPENKKFGPFVFTVRIGNGEAGTPYYIKNQADLQAVGGTRVYSETKSVEWSPSAHYEIIKDINLEGEWTPLCQEKSFTGTLKGQLKTISNLTVTESQEYAGLFAEIGELASIDSIIFENPVLDGRFDFAGVVAGASWASTIQLIEVRNGIVKAAPFGLTESGSAHVMAGGIVGCAQGIGIPTTNLLDRGIITSCSFQGIVGTSETVNEVTQTAKVSYFSQGGIVGYALGATVLNTKADVKFQINEMVALKAQNYVRDKNNPTGICFDIGGIAGLISNLKTSNNENVETDAEGNIIDETQVEVKFAPIIKNNLAIVETNKETTSSCGIVGHLPISVQIISNERWVAGNYYYSEEGTITKGGSILDNATTEIETRSDLLNKETYKTIGVIDEKTGEVGEIAWVIGESEDDFDSQWIMEEGKELSINMYANISNESLRFKSEEEKIETEEDFVKFYNLINGQDDTSYLRKYYLRQNYVLGADVDFPKLIEEGKIEKFEPIGGSKFAFEGKFDGNGKTIILPQFENEEVSKGQFKYTAVGLFAQLAENAEVKNLTIASANFNKGIFVGGVAGVNYGTINNCFIKDFTIKGAKYSGAMAGVNYGTIIGNAELIEGINFYLITINDEEYRINEEKTTVTYMFEEYPIQEDSFTIDNIEYEIDWSSNLVTYIEYATEIAEDKFTVNDIEFTIDWANQEVNYGEVIIPISEGKFTIEGIEYTLEVEKGVVVFGENKEATIAENKFALGEGETAVEYTVDFENGKIKFGENQEVEILEGKFILGEIEYTIVAEKSLTFGENQTLAITENKFTLGEGESAVEYTIDFANNKVTFGEGQEVAIAENKFTLGEGESAVEYTIAIKNSVKYVDNKQIAITDEKFVIGETEYTFIVSERSIFDANNQKLTVVDNKFTLGEGESAVEYTVDFENKKVTFGEGQEVAIENNKFTLGEGESAVEYTISWTSNSISVGKQTIEMSGNKFSYNGTTYNIEKEKGVVSYGKEREAKIKSRSGDWTNLAYGNIIDTNSGVIGITVNNGEGKAYAGAITGINHGKISGVSIPGINGLLISAEETQNKEAVRILGGLVGYNTGDIENCYGLNICVSDPSKAKVYIGGVVGINAGTIKKVSIGGELDGGGTPTITSSLKEGNQAAGGIAGIINEGSLVEDCIINVSVECNIVAGFAPYMFGEVKRTYVGGSMKGNEVGGFAVHMVRDDKSQTGGHIIDCLNNLTLTGSDTDAIVAGISVIVRYPAVVERSIVSCAFAGNGTWYYESLTNTREWFLNWVTSWMEPDDKLGTITDVIINTTPGEPIASIIIEQEQDETTTVQYTVDFENSKVSSSDGGEFTIENNQFTIGETVYSFNEDKTKVVCGETSIDITNGAFVLETQEGSEQQTNESESAEKKPQQSKALIAYNNQVVKYLTAEEIVNLSATDFEGLELSISWTTDYEFDGVVMDGMIITSIEGLHGKTLIKAVSL